MVVARNISTTTPANSTKNTEWVRSKLWKDGEAPGAADPYTQRPDDIPEDSAVTRLPREAQLDGADPLDKRPQVVRASRLPLPPQRTEADTPKEIETKDPSYEPATSMDGLEDVEVLSQWWDQPGRWSELDTFKGFGSVERVTDKAAIEVYLRRALVEVIALQETGALGEWATQTWAEGSREQLDATLTVEIVAEEGAAVLKGDVAAVADSVKQQSEYETEVARPERLAAAEAAEMIKAWDASWKEIRLNDEMKFAVSIIPYSLIFSLFLSILFVFIVVCTDLRNSSGNDSTSSLATSFPMPSSAPPTQSSTSSP